MRTNKVVVGAVACLLILFSSWVLYRASFLGINNVFSREQIFVEPGALTDKLVIEATMKALQADGHDTSTLEPKPYFNATNNEHGDRAEFIVARNTHNENDGYVLWGPKNIDTWIYRVSFEKNSDQIRCRVYRGK
jgi:hypothetical protein